MIAAAIAVLAERRAIVGQSRRRGVFLLPGRRRAKLLIQQIGDLVDRVALEAEYKGAVAVLNLGADADLLLGKVERFGSVNAGFGDGLIGHASAPGVADGSRAGRWCGGPGSTVARRAALACGGYRAVLAAARLGVQLV